MTGLLKQKRASHVRPHQIVAASDWLSKNATILERNDQGYPVKCRYANGSDDKDLAQHVGLNDHQAKALRRKLYGELVVPKKTVIPKKELAAQLASLIEVVADLAAVLGAADIAERAHNIGAPKG